MTMMLRRLPVFRPVQRRLISRSKPANGGGAGHHDEHHHAHPLWENIPFKKSTIFWSLFGMVGGGSGLVVVAATFQNKKHGFVGK